MSVLVTIDDISIEQRHIMIADLTVVCVTNTSRLNKGGKKFQSRIRFHAFEIDGNNVTVPFGYYHHFFNKLPTPISGVDSSMTARFNIQLLDRQANIKREAINHLNESHSLILSLSTGWGKLYLHYIWRVK